ncbi:hypothetical protein CU097_002172 [Rhizopus azygosporus]|uniref:Uncharacterized protein n=1 Tax=Rhizopus azygosporus TaxID=86630 RepID=A0A367J8P7_RHIAZ|nr:hypothetical protein CU097_002172 [Rhizopus azygosporus]
MVSEVTNGDFGTSLLARFPANAAMLCCQRVSIKSVICFQIHGFAVAFCMANLSHESIYTFTKVAKAGFPRSITELPQFISMRTINQLLQCPDLRNKMVQEIDHSTLDSAKNRKHSDACPCPINF